MRVCKLVLHVSTFQSPSNSKWSLGASHTSLYACCIHSMVEGIRLNQLQNGLIALKNKRISISKLRNRNVSSEKAYMFHCTIVGSFNSEAAERKS